MDNPEFRNRMTIDQIIDNACAFVGKQGDELAAFFSKSGEAVAY